MTEDSPTQATPGSEVFVSYASQDAAAANAIVEALERNGLRCWIAPRDVRAGAHYADAIVRAIGGAKVFVLVLSANAGASTHVGKEIERASSKKRPIIALRIDAAPLTPALEYFLSESQWIEAQAGMMEAAYAKLIAAIRESDRPALTNVPAEDPKASARTATVLPTKSRRNRLLFAAGLAVAAVTLAVLWAVKFRPAERITAEQSTTAETSVSDKSIAVLPFVDMSEKKDQEYMADGIAEELLNVLAQAPDLRVIARTSSFAFKDKNLEIAEIAKKLNVAYVLEGSVRTSGNNLRITAQLVRTTDSTHVWSERYDRLMDDIFAVQDEIANAIVQALQIRLKGGSLSRRAGGTQNLEAYRLYLQAVSAAEKSTKTSLDVAENYANQAVKFDPNYGLAWLQLALIASQKQGYGYLTNKEGYERAARFTQHALQLSPDLAEAHVMLHAIYIVRDFDWTAGMAELERAVEIDPTNTQVVLSVAAIAGIRGNYADAERQIRAAMQRDPLDLELDLSLASLLYSTGRFAEAEALVRSVIERRPDAELSHSFLAQILLLQGKVEAALAELELETNEGAKIGVLPILLHAAGRRAEAEAALKELVEIWADEWGQGIARVYAYMGDHDRAMEWLERAYQHKDPTLYNTVDGPFYESLADDPRYKAFLRDRLKIAG